MSLLIPYSRGDLVSALYKQGIVEQEVHEANGTRLEVYVPKHLVELVEPYST
jgi:GTP-binding protein HflX